MVNLTFIFPRPLEDKKLHIKIKRFATLVFLRQENIYLEVYDSTVWRRGASTMGCSIGCSALVRQSMERAMAPSVAIHAMPHGFPCMSHGVPSCSMVHAMESEFSP